MKHSSPELKIAEMSHSNIEAEDLIKTIGGSLEDIPPHGAVLIVKCSPEKTTHLPVYISKNAPALAALGVGTIGVSSGPMGYACHKGEDLMVPDASDSIASGELAHLLELEHFSSYIVRRIHLANEECWGCIAIFFSLGELVVDERQVVLQQKEIWVQLATTIIERKLLEQALRVVEIRSELAATASGVGVFDWDIVSGNFSSRPRC